MNLSEADFEITTPGYLADLLEAQEARFEREYRFAENQIRESWEQTRILAWYGVQLQIDKKDRQPLKKFMPLPWDAPETVDVQKMRELVQSAKWINANLDAPPEDLSPEDIEKSYDKLLKEWQQ